MITTKELAAKLRVSARQIRALAESGTIPFYQVGNCAFRFDEDEVLKIVRRGPKRQHGKEPSDENAK